MKALAQGGVARVVSGETTLEELERVIGASSAAATPAEASAVPAGREPIRFEERLEAGLSGTTLETRPVLVVDDDPIHRTVSSRALSQQGFHVVEAANGAEALERVSGDEPYALVLLDLRMPGLGGREVVSCLRAMPKTARLPIIVATSAADEQLEVELMEAGADDYIRKPIDPGRLVARVRGALRRAAA
jgi:CheY-like chemotaxis protein